MDSEFLTNLRELLSMARESLDYMPDYAPDYRRLFAYFEAWVENLRKMDALLRYIELEEAEYGDTRILRGGTDQWRNENR